MIDLTPKRILVPTDFSPLATAALRYARRIASRSGAQLDVIYADRFLPPVHFLSTQVSEIADAIRNSRLVAEEQLGKYVREVVPDFAATPAVVEDVPSSAITRWAADHDSDLIVMGTHGREGWNRMMLGSVTERVLRETSRPLLTVRSTDSADQATRIRRILCPVNFTSVARRAVEHAIAFAEMLNAELVLLHVASSGDASAPLKQRIEEYVPIPQREGTSTTVATMLLHGDPAQEILDYAKTGGIDLIVMGAQHKRFFDTTVIGTTTVRITRHSPCPVITVVAPPE